MQLKQITIILLFLPCLATAQSRNDIFVDAGINEPRLSATYGRSLLKHLDLGGGLNYFNSGGTYYQQHFAAFADVRPHWQTRHSLFFLFVDAGIALTEGNHRTDATFTNPNLYAGVGLGYCYKINKRGMGPYISFGLDGNTTHVVYNDPLIRDYAAFDAYGTLSIGFKF